MSRGALELAATPHTGGHRKRARADAEAVFQAQEKAKLKALRAEKKRAREAKRTALASVAATCAADIKKTTERTAKRTVERARGTRNAKRKHARATCSGRRLETRAEADARIAAARRAVAEEAYEQGVIRRWGERSVAKARPRRTSAETAQESDDEVRRNLAPEELQLFEVVKRTIRGSARRSRTEAFYQWLHDHPGEVLAVRQELVPEEDDFARQQAAYYDEQERRANPSTPRRRTMKKKSSSSLPLILGALAVVGVGVYLFGGEKTAEASEAKSSTGTPLPGDGAPFLRAGDTVIVASDVADPVAAAQTSAVFAALASLAPDLTFVPIPIGLDSEGLLNLRPLAAAGKAKPDSAVVLLWTPDAANHGQELHPTETELGVHRLVEVAPEGHSLGPDESALLRARRTATDRYFGLEVPQTRTDPIAFATALLADLRAFGGLPADRAA